MKPSEVLLRILSDDSENETPEKCRERRRRRIQMRRLRCASTVSSPSSIELRSPEPREELTNYVPSRSSLLKVKRTATVGDKSAVAFPVEVSPNPMPLNGWISIQGFSDSMDDRLFVKEDFCRSDIFGGKPSHFFAVYDGHGGSHVSTLCKNMMHTIMAEELTRVPTEKAAETSDGRSSSSGSGSGSVSCCPAERLRRAEVDRVEEWEDLVRAALEKSFLRMDQVALTTCACGKPGHLCGCQAMELGFAGSTAVVAILTPHHVVVANCGDSRAVLYRAGTAIPLSQDHKPERPDELERIRAAGGKLVYQNGVRVYGILNMSRALGRQAEDEFLILATDGLWDVISDTLACEVTSACLSDESPATAPRRSYSERQVKTDDGELLFPSKSAFAAAILCRLALGRGSSDNISVIVVDLKRHLVGKAK
ncbi:hypothetical protein PTKIN_Ptkin05aG0147100 [Pterospermum kingtungense]